MQRREEEEEERGWTRRMKTKRIRRKLEGMTIGDGKEEENIVD